MSAALIVLVIRSRKPFFRSRPSTSLFMATLFVLLATVIFPFTPLGPVFGFRQLPISYFGLIGGVIIAYIVSAEVAKRMFYRMVRL